MHNFWKLLIVLYKEQYLALRDQFRRGTILSLLLVLIYELQLFSYIAHNNKQYNQYIQYFKIYPIINHEILTIIFLEIILSLVTFLLILIVFLGLHFYSKKAITNVKQVSSQNMLDIPLNQITNQSKGSSTYMNSPLIYFFSLYAQLANFLFYQLQIYLTFKTIYLTLQTNSINSIINMMALITSLITLFMLIPIIIFFNIHKFDYSFKLHDCLGQTYGDQVMIEFSLRYLQLILVTFIEDSDDDPQMVILILFYLYSIVQGHRYQFYQNQLIQYCSTLLQGQLCLISILSYFDQNHIFQKYIFLGPFLLYLQTQIFNLMRLNVKFFEDLRYYNQVQLDMSLRFLYQQSMTLFVKQKDIFNTINQKQYYSLQVYSLVANHLRYCNRLKCFCQGFFPLNTETTGKSWKRYTAQDDEFEPEIEIGFKNEAHLKSFFTQLIEHLYELYIKSTPEVSISIWLSYIYFLTEIVKIPTKAFSEALSLNGNPQFKSIKNSMVIEALVKRARDNFDTMIQKKDLKNQKYNFQIAFSYDIAIKNVKINIMNVIKNLHSWYGLIIYDKFNLKLIKLNGEILYNQIQLIQTQLDIIFQSNPLSLEIENLYQIYYKNLNYYQRRNKNYRKSSKLTNIYLNSAQKEVFNKDSFVIYITLLHPIGNVMKYTRNFPLMSGYKDDNISNANIRSFMPDVLAKHHDMYLQNFVEKGRMNIVMTEHRFLLIKTKDKFIIPVWAKIRLENYSTEDFGASALVSKVNTQDNYILLNQYGRLEEISEQIFYQIQKVLKMSIKQIKGIDFLMLMPQLWKTWRQNALIADQDQEAEDENGLIDRQLNIDAIMILPNTQKLIDSLLNNKNESIQKLKRYFDKHKNMLINYFNQLEDVTFFHLKYKIIEIKTINQIAYILEIQSNKQLKKQTQAEKMVKIRNILMSIFPDYQEIKKQQTLHVDICDVQPSLIMEDCLMEDILAQNLNKYQTKVLLPCQLMSSQRSNTLIQYSRQNENNTIPTIEEQIPLIPLNQPVIQIGNSFHHSNSFSSESQLDESNQMQKNNDLGDRSSVASATGYQDQLSKKILIKSILYGNLRQRHSLMIKIIFFLGMLGLVIFSTIFFVQISIGFQTIPQYSLVDRNIQNMKLIYNNFLMFNNTNITEKLISEFNTQIERFQSIQQNYNLILSVYDTDMQQNISIYYSLNQIKEHMVEAYKFNETKTWEILLNRYFQYSESFTKLFDKINIESALLIDALYFNIYITFIASEIFVALLAGMLIPIQFSVQKKINQILGLLTTFNSNQIEKQFSFLHSLESIFIQGNFLEQDVSDDLIDKSKAKLNLIDNSIAEKQQKLSVHLRQNKSHLSKKSNQKNCLIIASKLALTLVLFILLSAYYFSINILWNVQHQKLDTIFYQIDKTFELDIDLAQILSQMTQIKNYQVTQDYMNQFKQQEDLQDFAQQALWQPFLDDMSTQYWQINESSTLNICNYFNLLPLIDKTNYYYPGLDQETCQNNTSKSIGSVIAITTILSAYQQLKQSQSTIQEIDQNMLRYGMDLLAALQILSTYQIETELSDRIYQYEIIHIVVYSIDILILMIAFYFGYIYLLRHIDTGVKNTKLLLTLIPIDFLTENSYVMSFMLQEQQIDQI